MWRLTSILGGARTWPEAEETWPEAAPPETWPEAEEIPKTWPEAEEVPKSWPVAEAVCDELPKGGAALPATVTSSSILFCEDSKISRSVSGIVPERCSTGISASDSGYSFSTAARTCSRSFSTEPDNIQIEEEL